MLGLRCGCLCALSEVPKGKKTENNKGGRSDGAAKPCCGQPEGEKTGEQMAWAPHASFLHRIWVISIRKRASRDLERRRVITSCITLEALSKVEWQHNCMYVQTSRRALRATYYRADEEEGEPGSRASFFFFFLSFRWEDQESSI